MPLQVLAAKKKFKCSYFIFTANGLHKAILNPLKNMFLGQ
jgi:hypothetical protein